MTAGTFRAPERLPSADGAGSVLDLFAAAVAAHGQRPALIQGDVQLSYAELAGRADAIAARLTADGVAGAVIAVGGGTPGGIAALLGVWRAGGVVLPLDPALRPARRDAMLADAGVRATLDPDGPTDMRLSPRAEPAGGAAHPEIEDAAYVFFTSGSTGRPKGILGRHAGLAHFAAWQRDTFGIGPADRVLQLTSWSFDVMLREICTPLISGASVVLPPQRAALAVQPLPFAREHRVSVLHLVPSLVRRWLTDAPPLPDLRAAFFAGEMLTGELVTAWRERVSPDAMVVNLYGPTETTLAKCWHPVTAEPGAGPQPVGRPLPGCVVSVVEPGGWQAVAPGADGEIVIRTPHRTAGYLDGGAAATFVTDPTSGDPSYRTGDRGRFDADGRLVVLGRLDDQVKIRGVRLDPNAVAAVLLAQDTVRQAAAVDVSTPDGETTLAAYVVGDPSIDTTALRSRVAAELGTAAIPAAIEVVPELPLLPSGKVDRAELRAWRRHAWDTTPGHTTAPAEDAADGMVKVVLDVCRTVVGTTGITAEDDLFAQGVDSMAALEIAARLEDAVGFEVPLGTVFDRMTAAGIAARLVELNAGTAER